MDTLTTDPGMQWYHTVTNNCLKIMIQSAHCIATTLTTSLPLWTVLIAPLLEEIWTGNAICRTNVVPRQERVKTEKWNVACGRVWVAHDGEESRKMGTKRLILGADPRWWRSIAPFRRNLRKEKREMRKVLIAWDLESEKMVAQARFPEADNGAEVNSISWWSTT